MQAKSLPTPPPRPPPHPTPTHPAHPQVKSLLAEFHANTRGLRPERILFYRDGVSEGQFREVYLSEYSALREACAEMGDPAADCERGGGAGREAGAGCCGGAAARRCPRFGRQGGRQGGAGRGAAAHPVTTALPPFTARPPADAPPITFIIVQKRHQTRLFPMPQDNQNRDRSGNILPGGCWLVFFGVGRVWAGEAWQAAGGRAPPLAPAGLILGCVPPSHPGPCRHGCGH